MNELDFDTSQMPSAINPSSAAKLPSKKSLAMLKVLENLKAGIEEPSSASIPLSK